MKKILTNIIKAFKNIGTNIKQWFKNKPTNNKRIMTLWEDNKALYKEIIRLEHENGYLLGRLSYLEEVKNNVEIISDEEWESIMKEIEEYEEYKE